MARSISHCRPPRTANVAPVRSQADETRPHQRAPRKQCVPTCQGGPRSGPSGFCRGANNDFLYCQSNEVYQNQFVSQSATSVWHYIPLVRMTFTARARNIISREYSALVASSLLLRFPRTFLVSLKILATLRSAAQLLTKYRQQHKSTLTAISHRCFPL